jgi:hypothetical protein
MHLSACSTDPFGACIYSSGVSPDFAKDEVIVGQSALLIRTTANLAARLSLSPHHILLTFRSRDHKAKRFEISVSAGPGVPDPVQAQEKSLRTTTLH